MPGQKKYGLGGGKKKMRVLLKDRRNSPKEEMVFKANGLSNRRVQIGSTTVCQESQDEILVLRVKLYLT